MNLDPVTLREHPLLPAFGGVHELDGLNDHGLVAPAGAGETHCGFGILAGDHYRWLEVVLRVGHEVDEADLVAGREDCACDG